MNNFFIDDLYQLGKVYVEKFPATSKKCERLNTFAVLENFSDVNAVNLAKVLADKNKPYFWSRSWARTGYNPSNITFDYPIFSMIDLTTDVKYPFKANYIRLHTIQLAVLDKYDASCNDDTCKGRNIHEIYKDTEYLLYHFFTYLRECVLTNKGWMHKLLVTDEIIDKISTKTYQKKLDSYNQSLISNKGSWGIDNLKGNVVQITVPIFVCSTIGYDPETRDFKIGYDRSCHKI